MAKKLTIREMYRTMSPKDLQELREAFVIDREHGAIQARRFANIRIRLIDAELTARKQKP
jgi:hypothetical protein